MKYIGTTVFGSCPKLTSVTVDDDNMNFTSQDGVLFNKDMSEIIFCLDSKSGQYIIPDSVTKISDYAFCRCDNLTSVIIPGSVTKISDHAFYDCSNLTSVSIPDGVTSIGNWVFAYCKKLTSISIPSSLTDISECAFLFSDITSISLSDSLTNISYRAFDGCTNLKNVYYTGSEDQWKSISVGEYNSYLLNADITYNYKPDAVTGLKLKSSSADTIELSWDRSELADGYIIERQSGNEWVFVEKINVNTATEYQITGLEPSTTYNFRIKAYKSSNYSEYCGISAVTNPIAVSGLNINERTTNAVSITWDKNTTADGYIVEMEVGSEWECLEDISDNSTVEYKKVGLESGAEYKFRVKAYKKYSDVTLYSEYNVITVCTNPAPVSKLTLTESAEDFIKLSWDTNYSADGYIVEMNINGSWECVEEISSEYTNYYKKDGLNAGTEYIFRVKAYKNSNDIDVYSEYSAITVCTNPISVGGLKLKARTADAVRLAWDMNASADGYIIEVNDKGTWSRVSKITKNSTVEYRKGGLNAGTEYTFRVKAYKVSDNTAYYSEYSTVNVCTNPTSINGLKVKGRAGDALRLSWEQNTSADGYIIEMKDGSKWVRVKKITNTSTIEFRKGGLKAGTKYSFRIKAYKMYGETALYSGYKTISATTNPSVVSGLKVKGRAADAVRLAWNKNTTADGYIIEINLYGTWRRERKITNNSTVEYRISGLSDAYPYSFRVKAYKMVGKTALYGTPKSITACTNPKSVQGFKAFKGAISVDLTWYTNDSADGYIIERLNGTSWTRVKKLTSNYSTNYTVTGLKPKTSYKFRIKAYAMSGKTAFYSAVKTVSITTTAAVNVTSLSLNRTSATMYVSDTLQLSTTINPFNASYTTVKYTSSNPKVVSVSSNGLVRALNTGTATITASCGGKKTTCKITVKNYSGVRGKYAVMKAYIDKNGKKDDDGNKYITYSYSADGYDWTMRITHNYSTDRIDVYISTGTNKSANFSIDYGTDELFIYVKGTVQGSHMSLGRDPQGNYSYSFSSSSYSGTANRRMRYLDYDPYFYIDDLVYNSRDVSYSKTHDLVSYTAKSAYLAFLDFVYNTFRFTAKDLGFGVY